MHSSPILTTDTDPAGRAAIVRAWVEHDEQARAALEAKRDADRAATEAAERSRLLAENEAIRARMQTDLPVTLLALMPDDPIPSEQVPLQIGAGGRAYLYVGWGNYKKTFLELVFDPMHSSRRTAALPAEPDDLAGLVASAARERDDDMKQAERHMHDWLYSGGGLDEDYLDDGDIWKSVRERADLWPEVEPALSALAREFIAARHERRELKKARARAARVTHEHQQAAAARERDELLDRIQADPVAGALLRVFLAAQGDRETWAARLAALEHELDQAQAAAESAAYAASRASERASEAQSEAARASRQAADAEYRAESAESDVARLKTRR